MSVSVIQLTDLHLFADTTQDFKGENPWQNLNAILNQIAERGWPELFLLTGDLSQDESPETYRILAELMNGTSVNWQWIPGNHDQPEVMADYKIPEFSVQTGCWQWLLLNSNSGHPYGALADTEKTALLQALQTPAASFQAAAVHHHPLLVGPGRQGCFYVELNDPDQVAGIDSIPLQDDGWLWQTLSQQPQVKAVICGHVHQAQQIERDSLTLFTTPATSIQFTADINEFELDTLAPGYRCFELSDEGSVVSYVERLKR